MKVKKMRSVLISMLFFVFVMSFFNKVSLKLKKLKKEKINHELKFYFYNCPIGIQPSKISKTPIKEIKNGIEIMEELNDVDRRKRI